ncbi:hypothetical protein pb186bvf_017716 [Paramecium bursaria]
MNNEYLNEQIQKQLVFKQIIRDHLKLDEMIRDIDEKMPYNQQLEIKKDESLERFKLECQHEMDQLEQVQREYKRKRQELILILMMMISK